MSEEMSRFEEQDGIVGTFREEEGVVNTPEVIGIGNMDTGMDEEGACALLIINDKVKKQRVKEILGKRKIKSKEEIDSREAVQELATYFMDDEECQANKYLNPSLDNIQSYTTNGELKIVNDQS